VLFGGRGTRGWHSAGLIKWGVGVSDPVKCVVFTDLDRPWMASRVRPHGRNANFFDVAVEGLQP
jgi:hypothetical protein